MSRSRGNANRPHLVAVITVVSWLWPGPWSYAAAHVNQLAAMVRRWYPDPMRFVCVTNMRGGFDSHVELVVDREDFKDTPSPHGAAYPSCYRRLRLFAPDAWKEFGERIVSIDLDCVITGDLRFVWNRPEDFVIWRDPGNRTPYCASMLMLRAGSRSRVWSDFDPLRSPQAAKAAGRTGSDQGWIAHCLGPNEATWKAADGVLSYRMDGLRRNFLPAGARAVFFHGRPKAWEAEPQGLAWVREHFNVAPGSAPALRTSSTR